MPITCNLVACDLDHNRIRGAGLVFARMKRGVTAMTGSTSNRKALILIAATLSGAVVAACIALAYPTPVANPTLGADWQCRRSAGIVTTCHRITRVVPSVNRSSTPRAVTLRV